MSSTPNSPSSSLRLHCTAFPHSILLATCAEPPDSFSAVAGGTITLREEHLIWKKIIDGKLLRKPLAVKEHLSKPALISVFKMLPKIFSTLVSTSARDKCIL